MSMSSSHRFCAASMRRSVATDQVEKEGYEQNANDLLALLWSDRRGHGEGVARSLAILARKGHKEGMISRRIIDDSFSNVSSELGVHVIYTVDHAQEGCCGFDQCALAQLHQWRHHPPPRRSKLLRLLPYSHSTASSPL